ncbi:MAG: sterol desaturase family protein [Myxococcales bacterium]|nr:sterol desaturase family protein [Myxococcales bacterium]
MAPTYDTLPIPETPPEQTGNIAYGIFGHCGSPVFYAVWLAVFGLTTYHAIVGFLACSVVFFAFTLWAEHRHPSVKLPPLSLRDCIGGLSVVFYKGVLVGGGFVAGGWWVFSHISPYKTLSNTWLMVAIGTLLTDLAYYWIHRMMSHSRGPNPILRYYRRKHAAHHSVSEMDFMRGNQSSLVDTALGQFQPALILISWALGMDLPATLAAYGFILTLQATDHTNVTFNIGWLRYIFMDNHAHKLHHCKRGNLINHAAAFSFFDRLWGTYYEDWRLSSNYLHHHRIALPIKLRTAPSRPARPQTANA